jgi:hypothetical protein
MDIYNKIATMRPINKMAGMSFSKGENPPNELLPQNCFLEPPQYENCPKYIERFFYVANKGMRNQGVDEHVNIVGETFGCLTAIGLVRKNKKARWVCKCSCGKYTIARPNRLKEKTIICPCSKLKYSNDLEVK